MRALIIDGYVDEPACLGVPPYMAPYPRYIAGALVEKGIPEEDISYRTIDRLRVAKEKLNYDITIVVAGTTVPGKYLRATPISRNELKELSHLEGTKILGGPVRLGFGEEGGTSAKELALTGFFLARNDIEASVYDIFDDFCDPDRVVDRMRTTQEIARWG